MQRFLAFVSLGLLAATAVRAQLTVSTGSAVVEESIGQTVTLDCSYTLSSAYTVREIKWYRLEDAIRDPVLIYDYNDGTAYAYGLYRNRASLINANAGDLDASLRLTNMQFTDNGTYECVVIARGSGVAPQEEAAAVELVAWVAPNDPMITDDYQSNTNNLTLTCTAYTGNPAANLTWYRDGTRIYNDRSQILTSWRGYLDAQSTISVIVNTGQSSRFECRAQHPAFTVQQTASVRIESPVVSSIDVSPIPTEQNPLQELDDVILTCMTQEGIVPEPTYTWQLDGGQVPASAQRYNNQLKIFSAQVEDSGTYTCTAESEFGTSQREVVIEIIPGEGPGPAPQGGAPVGSVVGGVVAALAFLVLVAIVVFAWWRSKERGDYHTTEKSPDEPAAVVSTEPEEGKEEEKLNLMEEKKEDEPEEVKVETQGEGHAEVAKKPDPDSTA